ncbi:response regulator transcription factor [Elusimicrobiota bacterium]
MAKILIVEDREDFQKLIKLTLEKEGHEVFLATEPDGAMKLLEETMPDIITLDINLDNDGDGFQLCDQIRKNPKFGKIPILMLTVLDGPEDEVKGLTIGADDYLPKPFAPKELKARISVLLRRSGK